MAADKSETLQKTFLALDRAMGNHARSEATCCGVTLAQCHVVMEIGTAGKTNVRDLAHSLGLDKSTLSRTIDGLVEGGFTKRAPTPDDRRYVVLTLTEKGRGAFDLIRGTWRRFCGDLLDNIPAKKHALVIEAMNLIQAALRKDNLDRKYQSTCCPTR